MATRMQQRRGTAAQWTAADPILAAGEIGYETDTNQFKIGDGVNAWSDLSYFKNLEDLGGTLDDYVPLTQKGSANGVAPLDGSGKIPLGYLTNLIANAPAALDTLKELADAVTLVEGSIATAIGTHSTDTTDVHGIPDTSVRATNSSVSTAIGTHSSDTTDVHGIADTSILETTTGAQSKANAAALAEVNTHNVDTTNVHGIADTALLATKSYADAAGTTASSAASTALSSHNSATANVHGISDTTALATKTYADNAVATHEADTTNVHGIADTSLLATKSYVDTADALKAALASPAFTGTPTAPTAAAGTNTTQVATTAFVGTAVSALVASAPAALDTINELAAAIGNDANYTTTITTALGTKAPLASPTFTGTVTIPAGAGIDGYVKTTDLSVYSTTALNNAAYLAKTDAASTYLTQANATSTYLSIANADERIQDTAAGMLQVTAGNGLGRVYDDAANSLTLNIDQTVISTVAARDAAIVTALGTAAADATTKANGAVSTAAADATTKANNAKSEAITAAATAADTKVSTHNSATTNVHGISDTSLLALKSEVAAVTATSLGLGNVTNTSDANKPVSTAQASAIATAKSEAIADATAQVNAVIAAAPAALNTLDELAAALGDDANYATTVTTALAGKVPSATPISQKTASYTLSSVNEKDSMIEMNAAGATTVTIPTDAAVAFPIGTSLDVLRVGAGAVDVAAASGVTVNATPGLKLRSQWSSATLIKRAANTWVLVGDLSA